MGRLLHRALLPSVTVVALAALAGCGSDDSSATDPASGSPAPTSSAPSDPTPNPTSSSTAATPDLPDCASVWKAGQVLPHSYRGCLDDGTPVEPKKHPCSDGSLIIEFDNQFYASAGRAINQAPDLAKSQQFRSALAACQA